VPYADTTGMKLWYEEAGSGPAVVFLHAGLMDHRMWDPQWTPFAERFRAIRFDAPGFGRSDPPAREYVLADVLAGLLDALSIERAALVGCSMGGGAEVDYALSHPERVAALVAVATGLSGSSFRAYSDEQEARGEAAWNAGDLETLAELWLEVWAPLGVDERLRAIAHESAKTFAMPEEVDPPNPAADRLGGLAVPTLVVAGSHDVAAITENCRRLAAEVPGARLEIFADSDHLPSYREADRFNRLVLGFLESALGSR
jgi:3-oxoadipate enol-lactonase